MKVSREALEVIKQVFKDHFKNCTKPECFRCQLGLMVINKADKSLRLELVDGSFEWN